MESLDKFADVKYDVHSVLIQQAFLNYAKIEITLRLQVEILAKLEGKTLEEVWARVEKDTNELNKEFLEIHETK